MISDIARSVALLVPKALGFLAILLVGWLVAVVLRRLTARILHRVGFDRLADRGGVRAALARSGHDASEIAARLVFCAVLLFTLQLAFGLWGPNPVSVLIGAVVAWLPRALVAVLIVVIAAAIAAAVRDIIGNVLSGLSYGRLLATTAYVFIMSIGVIAALNQVGIGTTVTTPILITVLATIGGILIVGVGGGLIRPMQARWETWLNRAGEESGRLADSVREYAAARAEAVPAPDPDAPPVVASAPVPQYAQGRVEAPAAAAPTVPTAMESLPMPVQTAPAEQTQKFVRSDQPPASD